jgi:hypothetical protein
MSTRVPSCVAAMAVLRTMESSLVSSMEAALGRPPRLEVISASRGPAPSWAVPPLAPKADVMLRWTAYRLGGVEISRHVAALQISVLGTARARDLEEGQVTLAALLDQPGVERTGRCVGLLGRDVIVAPDIRRALTANGGPEPWACRRYHVTVDGIRGGVVLEVLPCETWERMMAASQKQGSGSRP